MQPKHVPYWSMSWPMYIKRCTRPGYWPYYIGVGMAYYLIAVLPLKGRTPESIKASGWQQSKDEKTRYIQMQRDVARLQEGRDLTQARAALEMPKDVKF